MNDRKVVETMDEPYPKMHQPGDLRLPTATGNTQPLWQALAKLVPDFNGRRVLAIHSGDGWFCRYAVNHGAIAVLGIDDLPSNITASRKTASSDRLRYRIMPDHALDRITGTYDYVLGTFDALNPEFHQATEALSKRLTPSGQMLVTVNTSTEIPATDERLQLQQLVSDQLVINRWYQIHDTRLNQNQQLHFLLSAQRRIRSYH